MTNGKVSTSAMAQNAQAARNLPITAWVCVIGSVSSISMVPSRRSSAHSRMVIAGTSSRNTQGMKLKNGAEVRLVAVEEVAEVEGQHALQRQEDDDEHDGDRRGEIAAEFAAGDDRGCCA